MKQLPNIQMTTNDGIENRIYNMYLKSLKTSWITHGKI